MVMLIWTFFQDRERRVERTILYLAGCSIPFLPMLWLFIQGPRQTIFNVLQYQTIYRRTNWGDANLHDLDALSSWLTSPDALLLAGLLVAAVFWFFRDKELRALTAWREFLLAGALGLALVLFISTAHPTFERYYIVAMPFLAILGGLGFYPLASRIASSERPGVAGTVAVALLAAIWLRGLFDERDDEHWSDYEQVAQQVAKVTPVSATLYADEVVYFLLDRTPPPGMEFSYAQRLELPSKQAAALHIVSSKELKQQMQRGRFATLQTCRQALLDDFQPQKWFRHHADSGDCDVFWTPKGH
jgi:hypothetical protein